MRRHPAAGGFTLVETMVALALLAALGLLLAGAMRTAGGAWQRSRGISEETALRDGLRLALDRQLGQAQPVPASPDQRDERIDFLGGPDAVSFRGPLPEAIAPGVVGRQQWAVLASVLVLAWQLPGDEAPRAVLPVLEGVQALSLRYWAPPTPEDPGGWQAEWRDRARLPGLVAIEIVRTGGAPLSFLVAPRVTATVACLFDPVGPACRRLP
jgi:type II secretory pathway pseudopilin PulG